MVLETHRQPQVERMCHGEATPHAPNESEGRRSRPLRRYQPYGVVYFASYFRYCHHGIEELLRHVGCPPHEYFRNPERGFGLPIVGASCDFLRPVRYGDQLTLFVSVLRLGADPSLSGFISISKEAPNAWAGARHP